MDKVTIPALQQMKRDGEKIVAVVAYDYQMAQIVDRAGVDIVSVGDSVGSNIWGQTNVLEVTMDQMVLACQGVRRGVKRALVSCDFPYGPLQESTETAVRAAVRLVKEGGADLVKLDGAADYPDATRAIVRAGVPVFGQFGITPQTAARFGGMTVGTDLATELKDQLLAEAKIMEEAGRFHPRLHLFRARRGRRRRAVRSDSRDRRARRRPVARRPHQSLIRRHRLHGRLPRRQRRPLRRRGEDQPRSHPRPHQRRPRLAPDPRRSLRPPDHVSGDAPTTRSTS